MKTIFTLVLLVSAHCYGVTTSEKFPISNELNSNTDEVVFAYGTYQLVDAETNTVLRPFAGDQTFALSELGSAQLLTIEAFPPGPSVESLVFTTDIPGDTPVYENNAPYGYRGASSVTGNYSGFTPPMGTVVFTIEYFSGNNGTGTLLGSDTITFEFVQNYDTQAPTAPTLTHTGQTDTTADLSWSGATDNTAVTDYKVFKDGTLEATLGNVSTYQVTGLAASTTYAFTVTALDAAANESVPSTAINVTTDVSSGGSSGNWAQNGSDINYTAGKVGIGTANPDYTLTVKGKIHTEEVKVDLSVPAPDYVFKADYDLRSLSEVRDHIKTHGHLPNIPSALEMETHGIDLGTMEMRLLEKIEELTLYLLQQEEQIKQLQQQESLLENCAKNRNKYK